MTTDAVLVKSNNVWDFQIDANGDIQTADFYDTAILCSLFMEQRATASEVQTPERRRGWIGNEATPGIEMGSKMWLFEQSRITRTVLNGIRKAALNALEWLITDGHAVDLDAEASLQTSGIVLTVTIYRSADKIDVKNYTLWQNSGVT